MTVVVIDNFNASTNNIEMTAHTPDTGNAYTLYDRTSLSQSLRVLTSGSVRPNNNHTDAFVGYVLEPDATQAHVKVTVVLKVLAGSDASRSWWVLLRVTDTSNWYGFRVASNGDVSIHKNVAGTISEIGTGANVTLAATDSFEFEANGTSLTLSQNSTQRDSATDSSHTGAGQSVFGVGNHIISTDDIEFSWDWESIKLEEFAAAGGTVTTLFSTTNIGKSLFRKANL